ncbi:MAG: hypothetical protein GW949_06185 [Spirochaetales bacterium]|nr:hypothetical protein [Spirochaetales bacterium]
MKLFRLSVLTIVVGAFFVSCATSPPPPPNRGPASGPSDTGSAPVEQLQEVFPGNGRGNSLGTAINSAKIDAVRNSVVYLIGQGPEAANQSLLEDILYRTPNPNQYVYADTMETLRRDNLGTQAAMDMVYEITIRVRMDLVRQILESNGLMGSGQAAQADTSGSLAGNAANTVPEAAEPVATEPVWEGATPEQRQFLNRYLSTMTYLVYFDDESIEDTRLLELAVSQANSFLLGQGYTVIFPDQIEQLRSDAQIVFEDSTGQEQSILQFVAQRLNADVYVEFSATTSGETSGSNHYGQAIIGMNIFETSTGQLLGTIPYTSPRTLSRVSQFDAQSNAIQSSVFQAMPRLVDQTRSSLERQYEMGIRYDLVLQNTSDARLMSQFRQAIRRQVSEIITVSQTPEETRYTLFFFGRTDDLIDIMFGIADRVPGLQNMDLVITRGKSLTFDTGL